MKISLMTLSMVGEMLFKFHLDQDFEGFAETYDEMLDLVKECGYSAVDVTVMETTLFRPEDLKAKLQERGFKVSSYIYMAQLAAMDEEGFAGRVREAKAAVDMAEELGTDVLMLVPQAQEEIGEYSPEQIRDGLVRHFTPVVEYAKGKGIHVVVEDTPDLRLHFCAAAELKDVLDRVPGLEMVYDSGNMILAGEDPVEYYDEFADRIAHIHLKDMRIADAHEMFTDRALDGRVMTGAPTGTGLIDLENVMKHVRQHGYDGYLTIEFAVDAEKDYRGTLRKSREYIESLIAG